MVAKYKDLKEENAKLWDVLKSLAEKLEIDPDVARSHLGDPADVFLQYIQKIEKERDAALRQLSRQKSRNPKE